MPVQEHSSNFCSLQRKVFDTAWSGEGLFVYVSVEHLQCLFDGGLEKEDVCCLAPTRCSWPVDAEVMAAPISHHDPTAAPSSIPLLPSEMGHCLPIPCRGSQLMTKST